MGNCNVTLCDQLHDYSAMCSLLGPDFETDGKWAES